MLNNDDPKKRPLLSDRQLAVIRLGKPVSAKASPREEFEKLFRPVLRAPLAK